MTTIKCRYCGGSVTLTGATHGYCDYCGQELTFPSRQEERLLAMVERANHFRARGEFDRAYAAYEHLIQEEPKDAELHWSLMLCRYGVEYVEDTRLSQQELGIREFKPTLSRMSFEPLLEDPDYLAALEYADEAGRRIYRREAGKLARIQSRYLEIARREKPYDVFISFKAENEDGTRTKASALGQEIYEQLTAKGLKVFFSRVTLEEKLSEEYEPYIFAALQSAKVMLLIADNRAQIDARWVKNEWGRFLLLAAQDRSKTIVPVYNSHGDEPMGPYDFPDEIQTTQAQDMGKVGAMQDLVRGICKLTGRQEAEQVLVMEGGVTVTNLLRRTANAIQDGAFQEADQLIEQVMDVDAVNPQVHLYRLLAANRARTFEELAAMRQDWGEDRNYLRARRFAQDRQLAELAVFDQNCCKEKILLQAQKLDEDGDSEQALKLLNDIAGYPRASELAAKIGKKCEHSEKYQAYRKEIGDPDTYLERKFAELHPREAAKWKNMQQAVQDADAQHGFGRQLLFALATLGYSIFVFFTYQKNSFGHTDSEFPCLIWAVLCTLSLPSFGCNLFLQMILPAFLFFLLGQLADMFYAENLIDFRIMPVLFIVVGVIFVVIYFRSGTAELFRSRSRDKTEDYYLKTVLPIERQLRKEVEDTWAPYLSGEEMLTLKSIEHK